MPSHLFNKSYMLSIHIIFSNLSIIIHNLHLLILYLLIPNNIHLFSIQILYYVSISILLYFLFLLVLYYNFLFSMVLSNLSLPMHHIISILSQNHLLVLLYYYLFIILMILILHLIQLFLI